MSEEEAASQKEEMEMTFRATTTCCKCQRRWRKNSKRTNFGKCESCSFRIFRSARKEKKKMYVLPRIG